MKKIPLWISAMLLLAGYYSHTIMSLETTAPTFDEVAHLPAGYVQLSTGDARLNPEHPPLAKLLAAAPLRLQSINLDAEIPTWHQLDEWSFGRNFLFPEGQSPQERITSGRYPMVVIGSALAILCCVWSSQLFGPLGGLLSLALCALSPTLLAHSRLVTTDVPVAFFGYLTLFVTWKQVKGPSWLGMSLLGLCFGATLAAKFTGFVFGFAAVFAVGWTLWRHADHVNATSCQALRVGAMIGWSLLLSLIVIFVSYGTPNAPLRYLEGIRQVGFNHTQGYEFFLMGEFRQNHFPMYFPTAVILKESPGFLLATLLFPIFLVKSRRSNGPSEHEPEANIGPITISALPFLVFPSLLYFVVMMINAPNIGIRYIIPALPGLMIAAGIIGQNSGRWNRVLVAGLLALQCHGAIRSFPDPISYFNGLWGCEGTHAIQCLDDSNVDWGQDLARISAVIDPMKSAEEEIALLYFGTALPTPFIGPWRMMTEDEIFAPRPQLYVVSTHRFHRLHRIVGEEGDLSWFRRFPVVASVGNTFLVFDLRQVMGQRRFIPSPARQAASSHDHLIY